jgi:hypothetical protein
MWNRRATQGVASRRQDGATNGDGHRAGTRKGAVKRRSQRQTNCWDSNAGPSEVERVESSCRKRSPAAKNSKAYGARANDKEWAVSEDNSKPAGNYASKDSALEAIYLAASNDIKSGHGVTIRIEPPPSDAPLRAVVMLKGRSLT